MKIENYTDVENYLKGGYAEFTLRSARTGNHRTYKTRPMTTGTGFFVMYLGGTDNNSDYRYLGILNQELRLIHTKASPAKATPSFNALDWFLRMLIARGEKLSQVEFLHSGKCSRCNRKLTTPESIESGMGPVCRGKI